MKHAGVNLKENGVADPSLLSCYKLHRMHTLEAKVYVLVEIPLTVDKPTALVASGRGNRNVSLF